MDLSIIVPVFNVEKYIRACIESIFRQGLDESRFEIIVVNDGTKDCSMEVIRNIISAHKNIVVINQENLGLSVARNNGMAIAKGEYIQFVDSDDLLVDNSLNPLLDIAIISKADLVIADYLEKNDKEIDNIKQIRQLEIYQQETTAHEIYIKETIRSMVWLTLYKKDFLQSKGIKFCPGICFEDNPFTHECFIKANKVIKTNILLYCYRIGNESITNPASFTVSKARDFCKSISLTWELRNNDDLSKDIKRILVDNTFRFFVVLSYRIIYGINNSEQQVQVLKDLKKIAPDLFFNNGSKQYVISLLFRYAPVLYLLLLRLRKKHILRIHGNKTNRLCGHLARLQ